MSGKCAFLLTLSLLFAVSFSQKLDCSKLSFDDDYDDTPTATPPTGILASPLPGDATVVNVCPMLRGQEQCCSADYFNNAKSKLRNQVLKKGLGLEAQPKIGLFHLLAKDVYDYYANTLNTDISANFANQVTPNATTLNTSPTTDRFDPASTVLQTLGGLIRSIKNSNDAINKTCVEQQSQLTIRANKAALDAFAKDIASVRNASTLFYFIDQYLVNITDQLADMVPPTDQCAKVLLKLTCGKCQKAIPKLCGNVCGAAAKGCFAPYVAALNPQFNILWNVTTQLVLFLNATLTDMFAQQNIIRQALIDGLMTGCNISVGELNVKIRPHGVGVGFLKQAQNLLNSGLLTYNESGPFFCTKKTSKSNCWNGEIELASDVSGFPVDSISGQANNPAGSFDEGQLTQQAQMLGIPVNSFLSSPTVSMVTPAAITIPQGQVYSGATTASASLLMIVLIILII